MTEETVEPVKTNRKRVDYRAVSPASDVKIIKADGTIIWQPSKKKYLKNYGEVKFSGGVE